MHATALPPATSFQRQCQQLTCFCAFITPVALQHSRMLVVSACAFIAQWPELAFGWPRHVTHHTPLLQSLPSLQVLPFAHASQDEPPQFVQQHAQDIVVRNCSSLAEQCCWRTRRSCYRPVMVSAYIRQPGNTHVHTALQETVCETRRPCTHPCRIRPGSWHHQSTSQSAAHSEPRLLESK
jgi:hypothetical protein